MPSASALAVTNWPRPMSDALMRDPDDVLWLRSAGINPEDVTEAELPAQVQYARDLQEANSRKYGNAIVMLMPLTSGNFAAFGIGREDVKILSADEVSEPTTLTKLAQHFASTIASRTAHITRLSELGIREPDGRTMARDLRASTKSATTKRSPTGGADIDLDEI